MRENGGQADFFFMLGIIEMKMLCPQCDESHRDASPRQSLMLSSGVCCQWSVDLRVPSQTTQKTLAV